MLTSPYIVCAHCGCEFLASRSQLKRSHSASYSGKCYCSGICQRAGAGNARRGFGHPGVCKACGKTFQSRYAGKIYCNIRCYTSSPEFVAMARSQAVRASAARILNLTGELPRPKIEIACLNCGTKRTVTESEAKRRKYCNSRCYREYMAGRFDRWIASPQSIALPQGYDEFLSMEELPCLIDGCGWSGRNLGNHVNFAHGITAEEFKRAAGFNLSSGLVTPAVSEILSSWPRNCEFFGGKRGAWENGKPVPLIRGYRSLEGSEHQTKAKLLSAASPSEIKPRTCEKCGNEYQPAQFAYNAKFCSISCREDFYKTNNRTARFWMQCGACSKDFQGLIDQKRRSEHGRKVFCCIHCRQINNGKIAGESHHQRYLNRMQESL